MVKIINPAVVIALFLFFIVFLIIFFFILIRAFTGVFRFIDRKSGRFEIDKESIIGKKKSKTR